MNFGFKKSSQFICQVEDWGGSELVESDSQVEDRTIANMCVSEVRERLVRLLLQRSLSFSCFYSGFHREIQEFLVHLNYLESCGLPARSCKMIQAKTCSPSLSFSQIPSL